MKRIVWLLVMAVLVLGAVATAQAETVEITYWQYEFASKTGSLCEVQHSCLNSLWHPGGSRWNCL